MEAISINYANEGIKYSSWTELEEGSDLQEADQEVFTVLTNEVLLYRTIISTLVITCKFTLLEKTIVYTISINYYTVL